MIRTPDLRLASFLTARGFPLVETERNGRRITFIIDAPESESRAFYGPEDAVSAKRLFESWRSLRNLIDGGVQR
jgi:hypothetical protein